MAQFLDNPAGWERRNSHAVMPNIGGYRSGSAAGPYGHGTGWLEDGTRRPHGYSGYSRPQRNYGPKQKLSSLPKLEEISTQFVRGKAPALIFRFRYSDGEDISKVQSFENRLARIRRFENVHQDYQLYISSRPKNGVYFMYPPGLCGGIISQNNFALLFETPQDRDGMCEVAKGWSKRDHRNPCLLLIIDGKESVPYGEAQNYERGEDTDDEEDDFNEDRLPMHGGGGGGSRMRKGPQQQATLPRHGRLGGGGGGSGLPYGGNGPPYSKTQQRYMGGGRKMSDSGSGTDDSRRRGQETSGAGNVWWKRSLAYAGNEYSSPRRTGRQVYPQRGMPQRQGYRNDPNDSSSNERSD